jgi:hypothetical protein
LIPRQAASKKCKDRLNPMKQQWIIIAATTSRCVAISAAGFRSTSPGIKIQTDFDMSTFFYRQRSVDMNPEVWIP